MSFSMQELTISNQLVIFLYFFIEKLIGTVVFQVDDIRGLANEATKYYIVEIINILPITFAIITTLAFGQLGKYHAILKTILASMGLFYSISPLLLIFSAWRFSDSS